MVVKSGSFYPAVVPQQRDKLFVLAFAGLAFSLFIILVVVYAQVSREQSAQPSQAAMAPAMPGTVLLYGADQPIQAGTKLSPNLFKSLQWSRADVPEGAIMNLGEIRGMYARIEIPANMPIRRADLTKDSAQQDALALIPGMRAVTILIDAESGVEGWVRPGTKVDVVLTHSVTEQRGSGNIESSVIVQNVRVLSLAGHAKAPQGTVSKSKGPTQLKTDTPVTLEVSPRDALKIRTAAKLGDLQLLMRHPDDVAAVDDVVDPFSKPRAEARKSGSCGESRIRIEGRDYIMDCKGALRPVVDALDP